MKKYRSIGLLVVALIFSGIAAFSSIKYLEQREQDLISKLDQKNDTEVIVPNRDLVVGDVISAETVSVRAVPSIYLPGGALMPSDFDTIAGSSLKEPVFAGKPLLRSQLEGMTGVEKFSQLLETGQRALTLPIDELQSNENMLVPGDYVDVLVKIKTKEKGQAGGEEVITVNSLLHRVLVLATGVTTVADPSYYYRSGAELGQGYGTITIGVASKEVPKIVAAKEMGELFYLLRNPEDKAKGRFSDMAGDLGGNRMKAVRVLSGLNSQNGLLNDSYRRVNENRENRWGNAIDTGRLYKKYNGHLSQVKEENVELGQR